MEFLSGYKTYIIAALMGIVTALVAANVITEEQAQHIYAALGAFGLATLRAGVAKNK